MKPNANAAGDMTVAQLLAQVCRMSGHHIRSQMEKIGLHRGQGFVLIHLLHESGIPQRDLARSMHVSPASVTNMLQRMERDGWIKRQRDESDQRVVRVFASERGKRLRRDARRVFQEMEDELSSIYTSEEQATLKQLLTKLYEHYAPGDPHPFHLRRLFQDKEESS
jgi:MarR family transcriptional regulator, organic hydroperoxide resistance regulator